MSLELNGLQITEVGVNQASLKIDIFQTSRLCKPILLKENDCIQIDMHFIYLPHGKM